MNNYASFVNLHHRTDRLEHMEAQLERIGLDAVRTPGLLPDAVKVDRRKTEVMRKRTPGSIGCHYAQVSIMEKALELGQNAFVMEDDLIFCEDFNARMSMIKDFTKVNDWDVMWLGGTFHSPAHWHTQPHNRELQLCKCELGRDCEPTGHPRFMRTYGSFCTYAYIVNYEKLDKILTLLDQNVKYSMGIDWLFIYLSPQLKTYAFVPGCVKQMDNQSDIGDGVTMFSGFSKLNGTVENSRYWYQEKMEDFNPINYKWT